MIPNNLKNWSFVKTKVHDLSGLKDKSPEDYYYQLSNGVYYPVVSVRDIQSIPNNYRKL